MKLVKAHGGRGRSSKSDRRANLISVKHKILLSPLSPIKNLAEQYLIYDTFKIFLTSARNRSNRSELFSMSRK